MQGRTVTSEQLRAARAVLRWSVAHLAARTGVGTATIKRYEAGDGVPTSRKGHLATLRRAYEAVGIEFVGTPEDAPGIRVHPVPPDDDGMTGDSRAGDIEAGNDPRAGDGG